jgi:hypothetical protein
LICKIRSALDATQIRYRKIGSYTPTFQAHNLKAHNSYARKHIAVYRTAVEQLNLAAKINLHWGVATERAVILPTH